MSAMVIILIFFVSLVLHVTELIFVSLIFIKSHKWMLQIIKYIHYALFQSTLQYRAKYVTLESN